MFDIIDAYMPYMHCIYVKCIRYQDMGAENESWVDNERWTLHFSLKYGENGKACYTSSFPTVRARICEQVCDHVVEAFRL